MIAQDWVCSACGHVAVGVFPPRTCPGCAASRRAFAASILGRDDHRIVRRFGYRFGRDFDKFKGIPVRRAGNGCPVRRKPAAAREGRER